MPEGHKSEQVICTPAQQHLSYPLISKLEQGDHGENKLALADERLQHGDYASQTTFDIGILLLDNLLCAEDGLEFLVWLLICELLDTALERLNLILCTLTDGTLSLSILRKC